MDPAPAPVLNEPPSQRMLIADMVAGYIRDADLSQKYGGIVKRLVDNRNVIYYCVAFNTPHVDGSVQVYGPRHILVRWSCGIDCLPTRGKVIIKNDERVIPFLQQAFVDKVKPTSFKLLADK